MKRYLFLFALVIAFESYSQKGSIFPSVTTETVIGREVAIPENFKGKYALIGVGTGKKAEEKLRTWQTPVYNKFILKTGLMDELYDVHIVFLPVFTGTAKVAKNKVVKELRENNESQVIDHVYIYSGEKEPWDQLGLEENDEPYFFLIDREGKVVWTAKGSFKQEYFDKIESILTQ